MGTSDGKRLKQLRDCAEKARETSYAPCSNFVVVAAVESVGGLVYGGANVEISNYSLTKHAEEVAILAAIGAGEGPDGKWLRALYASASPCGSCRQFAFEFATTDAICFFESATGPSQPVERKLRDLLPEPFEFGCD